ncbi:MAG TPA: ADOP family duplicated permease [Vicinamibacterales bacterium]|nr:ADOP family duplicated permease [Vicinamibacterales bacterium]
MPLWLRRWFVRLGATLSGRRARDVREEHRLHLDLLEQDNLARGMSPELARDAARRTFGNAALLEETSHDLFSFRLVEDLVQDLRYALREVRRSASFTCVAVFSLAIGIGVVTATFAVTDAFMLRGLPVHDPDRLIAFSTSTSRSWATWSYPAFVAWRRSHDGLFEVAAGSDPFPVELPHDGGVAREARVSAVSDNYFRVIGVDLALGRSFTPDEGRPDGPDAVAVISEAFWTRWFGGLPDALGRTIELNGARYQIVGVTRKGFTGHVVGYPCDVWVPLARGPVLLHSPALLSDRWGGPRWLRVVGRLAPGVTLARAAAAAEIVRGRFTAQEAAALGTTRPDVVRDLTLKLVVLTANTGYAPERSRYAWPLLLLSGITALVFLVACSNFSSLMLARSEVRRPETAIRLALGGGMWRLARQAATECLLLAGAAAVGGALVARWATTMLLKEFAVMIVPITLDPGWDTRTLGFMAGCIGVAIVCGLWPWTRTSRSATLTAVCQSFDPNSRTHRAMAGRLTLVLQLTLCAILLIGAGLLLRTVVNLRSQDLGFDRNVLLVSLAPGQAGYSEPASAMLMQRIRDRLSALKGIQAVGISGQELLNPTNYWVDTTQQLTTDRGAVLARQQWTSAPVGPGFFAAVGMKVVRGRGFTDRDIESPAGVAVINSALARFLFGAQDPIGRGLRQGRRGPLQTVIGVVNNARQVSPRDRDVGVVYLPLRNSTRVVLAVRTATDPAAATSMVEHQLGAIAGDVPIEKIRTIAQVLDDGIAQERLMSAIAIMLGALVVLIGCVGLYALMAYDVARRAREMGIRLALGATKGRVIALVLRDSLLLLVPALAAGVPLGVASIRPLSSQLYEVRPFDPWTLIGVTVLLVGVTLLATLRPARAASRIDPIILLRAE